VTAIAVAPGKHALGFDGSDRVVPDAYEILDLREALSRTYDTDAHLVSYVVRGRSRQPRINKAGLPYFDGVVETTTFFCDVDNPGHGAWSGELLVAAERQYESLDILATCGVYHTAHGRRIVQPIAEPIPVALVEPYLRRWLVALDAAGIAVDWACRDWTRHFRLPHVQRDGRAYRSPFVALDRMQPIALEPIAFDETPAPTHTPHERRHTVAIAWSSELPPHWEERAAPMAKAIRESVSDGWHDMYLAVSGALLKRGVPQEHLPALVRWIAHAAGSAKPWSHEGGARDSARRFAEGSPVTGLTTLKIHWPAVAAAVEDATATRNEARLRAQTSSASKPSPSLAEATAALESAIRDAPDGLTLISAECGLGKTRAAIRVASERASVPATGTRAPLKSKTSISVDKNALAIQVASDLRAAGTPVRRIFGPLSVVRDDGTPECRYHDVARPLVDGGQPMAWELCQGRGFERCEFYDQCLARDGTDGPDDARVTVGPHALLSQLDATAGSTGLLVIDEPPPLLETTVFSRDDLDVAERALKHFEGRFAASMGPALDAFIRWTDAADNQPACAPDEALRYAAGPVPDVALRAAGLKRGADDATDVRACAEHAVPEDRRSQAPPIQRAVIFNAKRSPSLARQLGTASKVLGTIRAALTSPSPVVVRVEAKRGLIVTAAREDLTNAVRRQGSVVVTDANADLHLPVLAKVVGYDPHFHSFAAGDGAPIRRTLIRCRSATRKGWFEGGRPVLDAGITSALTAAIAWVKEDPECARIGVITYRTLRLLFEAAQRPTDASVDEQWRALGLPRAALAEARDVLGPILASWSGEILFGHYGAMRGLNSMADVDALITMADPWPNVGDVQNDIAFLGLDATADSRLRAMCRAELEQAHGRIRAVHRTRPGRALHIGDEAPSGSGWTTGSIELRGLHEQPALMDAHGVHVAVLNLGGLRSAAARLRCPERSLRRYMTGESRVPQDIADVLRSDRLVAQSVIGPS
jgi:hypothetical protein